MISENGISNINIIISKLYRNYIEVYIKSYLFNLDIIN